MKDLVEKHGVQALFAAITSALGGVWAKVKVKSRKIDNLERGVQALLRDRITEKYYACHDRGYCPLWALESVEAMYVEYHALGGNGKITVMLNEMRNMPHVKPGETGE